MNSKHNKIKYRKVNSKSKLVKEQLLINKEYSQKSSRYNKESIKVYIGDIKKTLLKLPDGIVDCVITSPPYWKQRDYKHPGQIGQEDSYLDYIKILTDVFSEVRRVLKSTGTFFLNIGYKYQDKELLLIPELLAAELQKNGWALLNKIIWYKPNAMPSSLDNRFSNLYEPIFLFVKEESKYNYYLSIDELRIPVSHFINNKKPEDLIGLKVTNSLIKNIKIKGYISRVFKNNIGCIFVEVIWEDKKKTIEIVRDFDKESQIEVELLCQDCGRKIKNIIDIYNHKSCIGFPKPILPDEQNYIEKEEIKSSLLYPFESYNKIYNGKYKISPDNRGASPGARKSLFGEYLVLQRKYKIFQSIIADYLRFWRNKEGITIKEIDKYFGYKDTAGHWFRKDTGSWGRGGSIPLPNDWFKLKEILKFDNLYDRLVTETHLVLQTVKPHPKGKNPGDIWNIKLQQISLAHFATFPEELVRRCIEAGCPINGVVLDPFAGSGTTGKVAQDLGRDSILIELISEYLKIIKKRCKYINEVIYVK